FPVRRVHARGFDFNSNLGGPWGGHFAVHQLLCFGSAKCGENQGFRHGLSSVTRRYAWARGGVSCPDASAASASYLVEYSASAVYHRCCSGPQRFTEMRIALSDVGDGEVFEVAFDGKMFLSHNSSLRR